MRAANTPVSEWLQPALVCERSDAGLEIRGSEVHKFWFFVVWFDKFEPIHSAGKRTKSGACTLYALGRQKSPLPDLMPLVLTIFGSYIRGSVVHKFWFLVWIDESKLIHVGGKRTKSGSSTCQVRCMRLVARKAPYQIQMGLKLTVSAVYIRGSNVHKFRKNAVWSSMV